MHALYKQYLQKMNAMKIFKSVPTNARNFIGIQEKHLKRRQSMENSTREIRNLVVIHDPRKNTLDYLKILELASKFP